MNIDGNIEATLWRHRWRNHREKTFFGIIYDDIFHTWCQILSSRQTVLPKVIPEVEYTRKIAISISDILDFWSTL